MGARANAIDRIHPDWKVVEKIPAKDLAGPLLQFHDMTFKRALATTGKPKSFLIRRLFDTKDAEGKTVKGLISKTRDTVQRAMADYITVGDGPEKGYCDPRYSIPPHVSIILSQVIECRRLYYWSMIMSEDHDDKTDAEIKDYSKSCREHSKAELLQHVKRACESHWK
tara:strand:- start:268 stop:771 length:504 start_codon:yes stop_codon:yes gene_type:complete